MTESEWLACSDPVPMLEFLRGRMSDRKMRLFACALCRSVESRLRDRQAVRALAVAERYADGTATARELDEARNWAQSAISQCDPSWRSSYFARCAVHDTTLPGKQLPGNVQGNVRTALTFVSDADARRAEADVLRDLLGPLPFSSVTVEPSWLSSTVLLLARGIYEERAFDRLPVLADALQDEGCDDERILEHCRGSGPHVKGCWVIDMVLGKT